ncbi:Sensor protein QseC [Vibrio thalassae]|uniref:histidine kinase n=1 Tax=Vibrio thalassae TaxID=1243014 RepID=A0A240EHB8_9VIBR|nr:HAMP domain-containing sensor histidine kinase [Vibrio thalassae]SNX47936.1 Sensor protein QseC [Vibrio thalassae]
MMKRSKSQPSYYSIKHVKARLLQTFSLIALVTSFLVFFAFSLHLALEEDDQIEHHLVSFEEIAQSYYQLRQVNQAQLSKSVTAYFDANMLPKRIAQQGPLPLGKVTKYNTFLEDGFLVYHTKFQFNEQTIPLYLTIDSRAMDFGDGSWDTLMLISMLLMVFLIFVLRLSLKRVFDTLMSPISSLTHQLASNQDGAFSITEHSIIELQTLTEHLNSYTQMKERVARQELMFAKYASHELKTPIAVVLGAANLQAMKQDEAFQTKQRELIIKAANGMQQTVELLLNIVKQENSSPDSLSTKVTEQDLELAKYHSSAPKDTKVTVQIEEGTTVNLPLIAVRMIVGNLLDNATRFTAKGEISVRISSQEICITDNGSGLNNNNDIEHGLGLLIVHRIAESYGWQFTLSNNTNGNGCCARLIRIDS